MLLAPDAPWLSGSHAPALHDAEPPAAAPEARPEELYVWRQADPAEGLKDLFWLSGVVPPDAPAGGLAEAPAAAISSEDAPAPPPRVETRPVRPAAPAAANAEASPDTSGASPVLAVPPSEIEAPPPLEVIAYAPPRPFQAVRDAPAPQTPANDAVTSEPAEPAPATPEQPPARGPVGAAEGHEA